MSDSEKFAAFKRRVVDENEQRYGKESRKKYGDETVDRANANVLSLSREDYDRWTALGEEILKKLETAVQKGADSAGETGLAIAALHHQWLMFSWEKYTPQAHAGLAQMYVADQRFIAYYDRNLSGCAAFLQDAITAYTKPL